MTTPSIEERVARLEGGYEHLATKADVETLRAELVSAMAAQESRLTQRIDRLFWAVIGVGGGLLAVAVAALLRLAL